MKSLLYVVHEPAEEKAHGASEWGTFSKRDKELKYRKILHEVDFLTANRFALASILIRTTAYSRIFRPEFQLMAPR
jgi:hypothetical protein